MALVLIAGLGLGAGLALALRGLFPPPLTLRAAMAELADDLPSAKSGNPVDGTGGIGRIAGRFVGANVVKIPRLADVVIPDLEVTATPMEAFAMKVMGSAIALGMIGPILWAALGIVGVHLGYQTPFAAAAILGIAGMVAPFVDLHRAAVLRRRHFCRSLSTYASLVAMSIAGSMGWSSALEVAASISSSDWAMDEIAGALLWARAYRKQPWEGLGRLAGRLGIPDLADLARSIAQAGDGARIHDSLEVKAKSLRSKEATALENEAAAVTQRMLLPGVLLMAGYGVLVFYPALATFTSSRI